MEISSSTEEDLVVRSLASAKQRRPRLVTFACWFPSYVKAATNLFSHAPWKEQTSCRPW